jgi:cysteine desulfurase
MPYSPDRANEKLQNPGVREAIYLDYHATTPCDPRVVDAMQPYWTTEFGNPASRTHAFGWRAAEAVERAREQVARAIGADPRDVIFTSGATEANNIALFGAARGLRERGDEIAVASTEHKSVLDPADALAAEGVRAARIPVGPDGLIDPERARAALGPRTLLVSVMHANGEIGVVQPIAEIAAAARAVGALVHCDAAQSVGKLPVDVEHLGVDLLSISGHKLYGPKGIGALYARRRNPKLRLAPIFLGGGHERGLRSGTLPVPLCVGLGAACEIAGRELKDEARRVGGLRDLLRARLEAGLEDVTLNGHATQRLPGNLNLSFTGVEASALLAALDDVAVSTGSACSSARPGPSHVLRALGLGQTRALSSVRFGLGRFTTRDEIERAAARVIAEVTRLRELSPLWSDRSRARRTRA